MLFVRGMIFVSHLEPLSRLRAATLLAAAEEMCCLFLRFDNSARRPYSEFGSRLIKSTILLQGTLTRDSFGPISYRVRMRLKSFNLLHVCSIGQRTL